MTDPYQQTIDVLARSKKVLITTHVRPDGDALGTTAALVLGLLIDESPTKVLEEARAQAAIENAFPFDLHMEATEADG
jgi:nanoRNase/pAp phosphatase (c-di-AMP/oligoRNAs hydrolase)